MIIIVGADSSGKTTLAKKLSEQFGHPYYHFIKDSSYHDYIEPLTKLELTDAVLDRFFICEYPYSSCMGRKFAFTQKEWHNMLLLTLVQNPVIILCTHKPPRDKYDKEQYLPYDRLDRCLSFYREFLNSHHILYTEYDYSNYMSVELMSKLSKQFKQRMDWWVPMWNAGYGYIGSVDPDYLLVAERIGPNNSHSIPFETGPTGHMLTDMLVATSTPLGKFAVTNLVKVPKSDGRSGPLYDRPVSEEDCALFETELTHLKPGKVVFMGAISRVGGMAVAKKLGIPTASVVHLGYFNYKGITDLSGYYNEWRKITGLVPTHILKLGGKATYE